ncbi:MAG: chromate resistance protein [Bauldia litoralis]
MIWVTRDHVHMDRVACPWLIKRFVDAEAQFDFVRFGSEEQAPEGTIPFAIPGAELGPHDADGSTFRKILRKYGIDDPALEMLAAIIESGITHVFSQIKHGTTDVAALPHPEGIGLDAISQGMMHLCDGDLDDIERSLVVYDALYAYCRGKLLEASRADLRELPVPQRWDAVKAEFNRAGN